MLSAMPTFIAGSPSREMQHGLADEIAVDQPPRQRADLAPRRLDRHERLQRPFGDQAGEDRQAFRGRLDPAQFVEERQAIEPRPAGLEEVTARDRALRRLRYPEMH